MSDRDHIADHSLGHNAPCSPILDPPLFTDLHKALKQLVTTRYPLFRLAFIIHVISGRTADCQAQCHGLSPWDLNRSRLKLTDLVELRYRLHCQAGSLFASSFSLFIAIHRSR